MHFCGNSVTVEIFVNFVKYHPSTFIWTEEAFESPLRKLNLEKDFLLLSIIGFMNFFILIASSMKKISCHTFTKTLV